MLEEVLLIPNDGQPPYKVLVEHAQRHSTTLRDATTDSDYSNGVPLPIASKRLERLCAFMTNDNNDDWCKRAYHCDDRLDLDEMAAHMMGALFLGMDALVQRIRDDVRRYFEAEPGGPDALYAEFGVTDAKLHYHDDNPDVCAQVWQLDPKLEGP